MRVVAVIGLGSLALLDGGAAVLGVVMAEALVHDPQRPLVLDGLRGLIAAVLIGGAPALAGLLSLSAAVGVAVKHVAGAWLGGLVGALHLGVPGVGLAVLAACVQLVREATE